jgi:hypothetical protein
MSFASGAKRAAIIIALGLLAACAPAVRPPVAADTAVQIERSDHEFDLARGVTRVAIENPWGEINVRASDEREVGVHAVVQRAAPGFARPSFRSHREGDTLTITLGFDGAAAAPARIDAAVFVPNDVALALTTGAGRISAKRRKADVAATSDGGEIQVSSYARLTLRSNSGQIRAIAIGARWRGASTIESNTGRIVLLVPTFGDIALDAQSGGALRTGFGLSVHARADGGHAARARYGSGASPLLVKSVSGEIVLEQLVLLGDDSKLPEDDD